jgi:holo-[acyl-carrier protein] synthase
MRVRVGVDIAHVDDVAASVSRFGSRYLDRLFTGRELADSAGANGPQPEALAARFAAKEAALKLLRPGADPPGWRAIEVTRAADGAPELALHDTAAELAAELNVIDMSVSMSHDGDVATAVVVALLDTEVQHAG